MSEPHSSDGAPLSQRLRERYGAQAEPTLSLEDDPRFDSEDSASGALLEKLRSSAPRGTRYRLLGEVARGGMGAILRVWDDELRRTLAMKVVLDKLDPASGETPEIAPKTLGRFLEEAQVTGQLDHPGIVPVHELGLSSDGRVYFTMRLVKGEDLSRIFSHVQRGEEDWTQVRALGVMLKVCEAMSYAHSKKVIHRDLKPANVMVGKFGEVYVMDWGLSRVLGREDRHDLRLMPQEASSRSVVKTERKEAREETPGSPLITMDGDVVGTPSFMSPEQAKGQLEKLGPESDVYSVGAMLYQLIGKEMPFVPRDARVSGHTILMRLLEGPPKPLYELSPQTPAELIAIVEKAMAREIDERYATMQGLAEDLRAFIEGRVVHAYETGAWAETRKWVRRNKPLAASLAAVLVVALAGAVAFGMQAEKATEALAVAMIEKQRADDQTRQAEANAALATKNAEEARTHAEAEQKARDAAEESERVARDNETKAKSSEAAALLAQRRAEKVTELVQSALVDSDPNQGGGRRYLVVDAMDKAIAELDGGALKDDPQTEAALQTTIAIILNGNSRSEEALRLATLALETRRRIFDGDHVDVAAGLNNLALCLESLRRSSEALPNYEAALEMKQRLHEGDHPAVANGILSLAMCLRSLGRDREALPMQEAALEMNLRLFQGDHPAIAQSLNSLGACLQSLRRSSEALGQYEAALEMRQRLFTGDNSSLSESLNNVALCLDSLGRSQEALPKFELALAMSQRLFHGEHLVVAKGLSNLGACLKSLGRFSESLSRLEEAQAMLERLYVGDHIEVARGLNNLGLCLESLGRKTEALSRFESSLEMKLGLFSGDNADVARALNNLGFCLQSMGRSEEALPRLMAALEMRQRLYPGDRPEVASSINNVATCLNTLGRSAEALPMLEDALEMLQRLFKRDHPQVALAVGNVAFCLQSLGRYTEAQPKFQASLEMFQRLSPGDHPEVALMTQKTASNLHLLGRDLEAETLAKEAAEMAARVLPDGHPWRARIDAALAEIREALERRDSTDPPAKQ